MFWLAVSAAGIAIFTFAWALLYRKPYASSGGSWGVSAQGGSYVSRSVANFSGWNWLIGLVDGSGRLTAALRSPIVNPAGETLSTIYVKMTLWGAVGFAGGLLLGAYQGSDGFSATGLVSIITSGLAFSLGGLALGIATPPIRLISANNKHMSRVIAGWATFELLFARALGAGYTASSALLYVRRFITSPDVRAEIDIMARDLDNGVSLADAADALYGRVPRPAVRVFCLHLVDVHEHGSDLASVFRDEAKDMRQAGVREIETRAGKASSAVVPLLFLMLGCSVAPFLIALSAGVDLGALNL